MRNELVLISWGGIGDVLVCTPTIRALKEQDPERDIVVYCMKKNHLEVLANNPHIDSLRYLHWKSMWKYPYHLYAYLFNKKLVNYTVFSFQHVDPPNLYSKSIKHIAADIFDITLEKDDNEIYLLAEEQAWAKEKLKEYKKVVLMHVHSRVAPNHLWEIEKWNELVKSLPEYTFIQIGFKDEAKVEGAIDWRGKTTLREAFSLMSQADGFIGVDAGMSHVSNAFGTPGVVLFGDSSPVFWGHSNNINIYKNVPCSPCYYYLWKYRCVYNHECMKLITVEEVRGALVSQMEKNNLNLHKTQQYAV
ncbi:glycosyltransferase family 9 protein [Fulvivirga sp. 29W222]|uniref:Glycosyltransferase family 9 protein n=1 Tax=Fulvivirga marina TaxID=2494733 RepID=A0A937G3F9_9BACT|nr:glycosyltransferase family 9 protein [Fulvivirga marina]MBL6449333.1 glycosyltransferase family 9 protein [Fulvivirga marina]